MFRCILTGLKEGTKEFDFIYLNNIMLSYHLREGYIYPEVYWIGNFKATKCDELSKFKGLWHSEDTIQKLKRRRIDIENKFNVDIERFEIFVLLAKKLSQEEYNKVKFFINDIERNKELLKYLY